MINKTNLMSHTLTAMYKDNSNTLSAYIYPNLELARRRKMAAAGKSWSALSTKKCCKGNCRREK